jgi:anti-sigma regulatory factor (Ser/Thr protein kinase)
MPCLHRLLTLRGAPQVPSLKSVDHTTRRMVLDVIELPAEPESAGRARSFVRRTLDADEVDAEIQNAMTLMVSELVTNVIDHGAGHDDPALLVFLIYVARTLRLEVHDSCPGLPTFRAATDADESGRGLLVVSSLADRWGIAPTAMGKYVFCELDLGTVNGSG